MRDPKTSLWVGLVLALGSCADEGRMDDLSGGVAPETSGGSTGSVDGTTTGVNTSMPPGTTTLDDSSSGGDPQETDANFVDDPDVGLEGNECDVWSQDCPAGEKCAPWANDGGNSWNATRCVPVAENPKQPGDPCTVEGSDVTGFDDCDVAAMCFAVNPETNNGICVGFCQGSAGSPVCSDADQECNISNDGVLILCLDTCDPILQDCQSGDQPLGCYPVNEDFLCWPDFSFDAGGVGDPCEYFNVCDVGLYCANSNVVPDCVATGCCTEYCDITDPDAMCTGAAGGAECVPWWDEGMAPPGFEHVGGCIIPA